MPTMRFNHMELTLPKGELACSRAEIGAFYEEIFGWAPLDVPILGQNGLLLRVDEEVSQFLLVTESDRPLSSPGFDHLGLLLETRAEVDDILAKVKAFQQRDARVEIKQYDDLEQGAVTVHAFYLRYLLPIYFDVQCMEWQPGSEPKRQWRYAEL
jgi:hypothetical protein